MRTDLAAQLARDGWLHAPAAGEAGLREVFAALDATVIQHTHVVVRPDSRALVTSARGLGLHTDHHRAEHIAWLCRAQTSEGGATLVADARAAFLSLAPAQRAELANIRLKEHRVYEGDADIHPLVEEHAGRLLFYYSLWLAGTLSSAAQAAFDAFEAAANAHVVASLRLAPDDVLVIDNRRMLHGRTAITGSQNRHLERHWLARQASMQEAA